MKVTGAVFYEIIHYGIFTLDSCLFTMILLQEQCILIYRKTLLFIYHMYYGSFTRHQICINKVCFLLLEDFGEKRLEQCQNHIGSELLGSNASLKGRKPYGATSLMQWWFMLVCLSVTIIFNCRLTIQQNPQNHRLWEQNFWGSVLAMTVMILGKLKSLS